MTKFDWITMLVPIIVEGFLLFIFQKGIEKKLERIEKRNELRDKVLISFWDKMQEVNDTLISANIATMRDADSLETNLLMIRDSVLSIEQFYDTNKYDLKIFEKDFEKWSKSWNDFTKILLESAKRKMTTQMQQQLGNKLQIFKENTSRFIEEIRRKY